MSHPWCFISGCPPRLYCVIAPHSAVCVNKRRANEVCDMVIASVVPTDVLGLQPRVVFSSLYVLIVGIVTLRHSVVCVHNML